MFLNTVFIVLLQLTAVIRQ